MSADFQYITKPVVTLEKFAYFVKNYCFGKIEKILIKKIICVNL